MVAEGEWGKFHTSVTVTLTFEFAKMTADGYPVLRGKLNDKLFVLVPFLDHKDKEKKDAQGSQG